MLRGYCKFLLQVGVPFSQSYVEETFSRYPLLARLLVELFEARFDPRREKPGKADLTEGRERFAGQLGMLCGDDAEALKALRPLIVARPKGRDVQYAAASAGLKGPLDRAAQNGRESRRARVAQNELRISDCSSDVCSADLYPLLARLLVELFEARFDPRREKPGKAELTEGRERFAGQLGMLCGDDAEALKALRPLIDARAKGRDVQYAAARAGLKGLLDRVASLDEDRIMRSFMGVIDATLRTGYYQVNDDGSDKDYIGFKFDSARVPDLPKPRPYREIFVYGPRVEGTHLRFGPVARGGLRWSDRREDFRTEVLGLVKAQMVKNTVKIPELGRESGGGRGWP